MMNNYTILVLSVLLISGCTSVNKNMQLATAGSPQTEVIFIRPSAFPAGANAMLIGIDDMYFGSLRNNQFLKVKIDSGTYGFQVKANGSPASSLTVELQPNDTVCLKSNINPATAGVVISPLMGNAVSWFELSEVSCPEDEFFQEYSEVEK